MEMIELDRSAPSVSRLFEGHRHLPAIREAILEARLGRAWGDDPETPTVARLDLGCYAIFGGDPEARMTSALIAGVRPPRELIYPDLGWRQRLLRQVGERVVDRPMQTYAGDRLDRARLRAMVAALAAGYRLSELDVAAAEGIDEALEPHGLQTYPSPSALVSEGMAWGAFDASVPEAEQALVALASSYTLSSRFVEVAIATREDHRGRGLAGALAARFCLAALDRDIEPCWSASNPISQRLALRLGFGPLGECEILLLGDRADGP